MTRSVAVVAFTVAVFAQSHWPDQLELDVKTQSWEAAARVGAALMDEIEAGRMFDRFSDVPGEAKARELYATALDHTGNRSEANRQREVARSIADPDSPRNARRLANLKASVLGSQIDRPAHFPPSDRVQIVAFWADWCAQCKPELEQLARYAHSGAAVVKFDTDHMDPALREYGQPTLPQLYIVDAAGHIRFHVAGFEDDPVFARRLDWMVEAALRRP